MRQIAWTGNSVVSQPGTWGVGDLVAVGWRIGLDQRTELDQATSGAAVRHPRRRVAISGDRGSRGTVSVVALSGNDLFFWLQGADAATTATTATTTANSTSVTVVSGTGLAANQNITIAGAGPSGETYIGMIVSGSGTSWVVSPATPTAQTGGALVTSPFSGPQTLATTGGATTDIVGAGENAYIVHNDGQTQSNLWYYTRWVGGFPFPPFPQAPEMIADASGPVQSYLYPSIAYADDGVVVAAQANLSPSPSNIYFWWRFFDSGWNPVPEQLPAGTTSSGDPASCGAPSIAWTGAGVAIVGLGSNGIYYWWLKAGTGAANSVPVILQNPAGVAGVSGSPSIAWTGNSVVIAAAGTDNNIYYWYATDASAANWAGPIPLPSPPKSPSRANPTGVASFSSPSIAWTGSSVVISAVDANTSKIYCWSQSPETSATWSPPQHVNQ